jgi:hypothetical protein
MRRAAWIALTGLTTSLALMAGPAPAEQKLLAAAKKAGFPAQNCQFCHTVALPKKETFKPEDLNPRGKWLQEEMKKRNAQEVDVAWLKEYKP